MVVTIGRFGWLEVWHGEVAEFGLAKGLGPTGGSHSALPTATCIIPAVPAKSAGTQRWLVEVLGRFVGPVDIGRWVTVEPYVSELLEALADGADLFLRSLYVEVELG